MTTTRTGREEMAGNSSTKSNYEMLLKATDAILLAFFLIFVVAIPLFDSVLLPGLHLQVLVQLKKWYTTESGDYLTDEKPGFFLGLMWMELVFFWPLCVSCFYAALAKKSWYQTACLVAGVNVATATVAVMGELLGSGKTTKKFYEMQTPYVIFSVVATLRGLIPCSSSNEAIDILFKMLRIAKNKSA